ncbi:unnamed protein product [Lactuca virosa]|uniref:PWWP domain-containing protein n=1 Tax=Lactuca virosa TaxID=75947 RepID=A0AAU9P1X0_9ASTR|nr:unnamed protein product [Lactuca virosa]
MGGVTGDINGSLVIFGDIIWVKLHEDSWWPAQVVDENSVSSGNKPSNKGSSSDVLVRLYGSYIFKYVDVHKSRAEFKKILEENNFNHDDIMKKSLEKDLPSLNGSSKKRQRSTSKGVKESSQKRSSKKDTSDKPQSKISSKKQKQEKPKTATPDRIHNGIDTSASTPNIGNLSGRRMKVMQSLGLVAPLGSPFPRNRVISPSPNPTLLS